MNILRWVIALAFIGHGIGHVGGFLTAWTNLPMGFTEQPWVLPGDVLMKSPLGRAFGLLWLVALVFLVGAGLGLLLRRTWWPTVGIIGAVLSLVVIVPWWNTAVPGARYGGTLFNLLVLVALLLPWGDRIIEAVR